MSREGTSELGQSWPSDQGPLTLSLHFSDLSTMLMLFELGLPFVRGYNSEKLVESV